MKKTVAFKRSRVLTRVLSLLVTVFLTLMLGSCMTFMTKSEVLPNDYVPTEDSGYVYGRFFKVHRIGFEPFETIGIIIQDIDTEEKYSFRMHGKEEEMVQISAVPPGNYRVDSVEYITGMIPKVEYEEFFEAEGYQIDFVVEPNTAVYLGDFSGKVETTTYYYGYMSQQTGYNYFFEFYPPENNYDETTADIQEKYPFLKEADITCVSNM